MKILITGGSGFLGKALAEDLINCGHDIIIYDTRKSEQYSAITVVGDVRDSRMLTKASRGVDVICHLAAEHRDDVRPISLYYDVNVGGAQGVINACNENSIKRVVFTSTVALYGLNACEPDEESPIQPFNDYGKSKHEGEKRFIRWANESSERALSIVRPTVIFGKGNRGNVYNLINQIAKDRFIMVGDGKNKKSMCYLLNIVKFLVTLLSEPPGLHIYNFADKPDLTTEEIIVIAKKTLYQGGRINMKIPYGIGLLGGYCFDFMSAISNRNFPISSIRVKKFCSETIISSKKLEGLGFVPPYSLPEALHEFISYEFGKN